jgi:hypothetical protein
MAARITNEAEARTLLDGLMGDPLLERAARARHRAEGIAMDELVRIAAADTLRYLDTKRQYPVFSSDVRRIFGEFVQGLRTPELIFTTDQLRVLLTDLVRTDRRRVERKEGDAELAEDVLMAAFIRTLRAPAMIAALADGVTPDTARSWFRQNLKTSGIWLGPEARKGGVTEIPAENRRVCPQCKGTDRAACTLCEGTGVVPIVRVEPDSDEFGRSSFDTLDSGAWADAFIEADPAEVRAWIGRVREGLLSPLPTNPTNLPRRAVVLEAANQLEWAIGHDLGAFGGRAPEGVSRLPLHRVVEGILMVFDPAFGTARTSADARKARVKNYAQELGRHLKDEVAA